MPGTVQEWLALGIVIAVAVIAVVRRLRRKQQSACNDCAVAPNCRPDDDVRVLDVSRHVPRRPRD